MSKNNIHYVTSESITEGHHQIYQNFIKHENIPFFREILLPTSSDGTMANKISITQKRAYLHFIKGKTLFIKGLIKAVKDSIGINANMRKVSKNTYVMGI